MRALLRGCRIAPLDAELLLAHVLERDRAWLLAHGDHLVDAAQVAAFRTLVSRREAHEPVAYLLGRKEFYGIDLRVDRRVLVPRPDTETLVEVVLNAGLPRGWGLDLGTGSGAVALALAAHGRGPVLATDISGGALEVASGNARRLGLSDRVRMLRADGFAGIAGPFAWIASNPPYIGERERSQLMPDVIRHEPSLALFSGHDGLDMPMELMRLAPERLLPGGWFAVECAPWQATELARVGQGWGEVSIHDDLAGRHRVVAVVKPGRTL